MDNRREILHEAVENLTDPYKGILKNHKDYIELLQSGYGYEIDRSRIDTPEKVIGWIVHLSGKRWVTKETIKCLIFASGVKIEWPC